MARQAKKSFVFRAFLTGTLSLLAALTMQTSGYAADVACDPQFMDAIEARGFAEAARENAQNQNLIFKPDGVFEYSCFLNHAQEPLDAHGIAINMAPTFKPIEQYTFANFGDIYMNTRYTDPNPALPAPPAGMCNAIAAVWEISRCINFYDREDLEGFFDLTHYTSNDPRTLPLSLGTCSALPYTGVNMAIDIAYNNKTAVWTMPPYLRDSTDYIADPVDDLDEMYEAGACGHPIPTGVMVVDFTSPQGSTPFAEKTCSNPACEYMPDADECTMP